ncbi:MAG: hypothetical protein EZS28_050023, partial [Streblomastix strix]
VPQKVDSWIIQFDIDSTCIVPTTEIMTFINDDPNADPEIEEWESLAQKGYNQYMVPQPMQQQQVEVDNSQQSLMKRYDPETQPLYDPNQYESETKDRDQFNPQTLQDLLDNPQQQQKQGSIINQQQFVPKTPIIPLKVYLPQLQENKIPAKKDDVSVSSASFKRLNIPSGPQLLSVSSLQIEQEEMVSERSRRVKQAEENRKQQELLRKEEE